MKILVEAVRGIALVLLWLPLKLTRLASALIVLATVVAMIGSARTGIYGPVAIDAAVAMIAGLVFVYTPRFHYWLRFGGRP